MLQKCKICKSLMKNFEKNIINSFDITHAKKEDRK